MVIFFDSNTWLARYGTHRWLLARLLRVDPSDLTLRFLPFQGQRMFCPGTSLLADGRLLITGGKFGVMTTLYDPWDDTWTSATNMTVERGYHSQLTLSDGRIFVLGGSWSGTLGNKYGELYDPTTSSWTPKPGTVPVGTILTNDVEGSYRTDNHMWLFEASNGRIFHAGPAKITHWIDLDGNGSITTSVYVRVPIK
jgi:galactose oxidase